MFLPQSLIKSQSILTLKLTAKICPKCKYVYNLNYILVVSILTDINTNTITSNDRN